MTYRDASRLAVVNGRVDFKLVSGEYATYAHWRLPAHGYTLCRNRAAGMLLTWLGSRIMCERCAQEREDLERRVRRSYLSQSFAFVPPAIDGGSVL